MRHPLADWTRRLAQSDESAMGEVVDALQDGLLRYARGLVGDSATARDIVQDAFIRIWNARMELDSSRSLKALLFKTTRNLALNHIRDEQTRLRLLATGYEPTQWRDPGPEATTEGREFREQLHGWIVTLPPRQREALQLSRLEGLSHDEVAAVMGLSPRTVNNHLVRALEYLRACLDVTPTGSST